MSTTTPFTSTGSAGGGSGGGTSGGTSGGASGGASGSSSNQRKERGAIAAQACDTCRTRKQKCDEQRPKCGLCTRMRQECNYREPQPTKKDKTLVEILERLKSIEQRLSGLPMPPFSLVPPQPSPSTQSSYAELQQQNSYSNQLSQQLSQPQLPARMPQLQLPPPPAPTNRSSDPRSGNHINSNLFDSHDDVWTYVHGLENQVRDMRERVLRLEEEKLNLSRQLDHKD